MLRRKEQELQRKVTALETEKQGNDNPMTIAGRLIDQEKQRASRKQMASGQEEQVYWTIWGRSVDGYKLYVYNKIKWLMQGEAFQKKMMTENFFKEMQLSLKLEMDQEEEAAMKTGGEL